MWSILLRADFNRSEASATDAATTISGSSTVASSTGLNAAASALSSDTMASTCVSEIMIPGAIRGISDGEMKPSSAPMIPAHASTLGRRSTVLTS